MMTTKRNLQSAGQSTIEFALMIVMLMSVVFFVLQLALTYSFGSYVHYATFMSARALLSSRATFQDQRQAATDVLDHMLGPAPRTRFGFIGKSVNADPPNNEEIGPDSHYQKDGNGYPLRAYSWLQGVRYTFRSPLFRVPMAGLGSASGSSPTINSVTLTSESWLGRDPSASECKTFMDDKEQANGNANTYVLDNESDPSSGC